MAIDATQVFVIAPQGRFGWAVVSVGDLIDRLDAGDSLADAIDNAAIDSINPDDSNHRERLRQLTETGDADAYWG